VGGGLLVEQEGAGGRLDGGELMACFVFLFSFVGIED